MGVHQTKIGLESIKGQDWTGKIVLDIGCGSGSLSLKVLKATSCKKIIGVDISERKIEKAKQKTKKKASKFSFFVADANCLNFLPDNSVNIIFCNIAFQQFSDKLGALKEMRRVLASKGEIFLNFIEEKSFIRQEMDKMVTQALFNLKISPSGKISKEEFNKLAGETGFSKIKSISNNHVFWYSTVEELLDNYQKFEVIYPSLKTYPEEVLGSLRKELKRRLESGKTEKGYGETWKVVFAHLIKD